MATDKEEADKITAEAVQEATDRFNDLIEIILLLAISERSKSEKVKMINIQLQKMLKWNASFAERILSRTYRQQSAEAYKAVKAEIQDLSSAQQKELENLTAQLEEDLNNAAETYAKKGRKLALLRELKKIREERLDYEDGTVKRTTSNNSSVLRDRLEFTDSKGRRIKSDLLMALVVGDTIWMTMNGAKASTWIGLGFYFGIHRSILDDVTTVICRNLNGTERDLRKDKLPPMHPNCRSKIEVII